MNVDRRVAPSNNRQIAAAGIEPAHTPCGVLYHLSYARTIHILLAVCLESSLDTRAQKRPLSRSSRASYPQSL